jgi:pimeloyl-ACP methyl ester carboxylesterase
VRGVVLALLLVALAIGLYAALRNRRSYESTDGATLTRFTLRSLDVGRDLHEILVVPRRHGRTLLVLLHGRGARPSSWLSQPFFDGLRELGGRAPTVLLLDGGDHSYWHDRSDGKWGTMVLQEAIPAGLARTQARRVAIGGISMGGFGALDLAARDPARFCAVGAHSAALSLRAGETSPGAFDDAADFARNDVLAEAHRRALYGSRVWVDVGTSDPFRAADTAFALALRRQDELVTFHLWPGSHDGGYWRRHIADYLRFYADSCG